jgi:hypothetical protein
MGGLVINTNDVEESVTDQEPPFATESEPDLTVNLLQPELFQTELTDPVPLVIEPEPTTHEFQPYDFEPEYANTPEPLPSESETATPDPESFSSMAEQFNASDNADLTGDDFTNIQPI